MDDFLDALLHETAHAVFFNVDLEEGHSERHKQLTHYLITYFHKKKPVIYHPGKILKEEFLIPAQLSSAHLARDINVSSKVIKEVIAEARDLNKDIATRLALYFNTAPTF
ncbi:15631_t:CDS:2 [Funneliformis geosporum]|nr:15631_t:CDS:2 [Funneliformis geosporum]